MQYFPEIDTLVNVAFNTSIALSKSKSEIDRARGGRLATAVLAVTGRLAASDTNKQTEDEAA